MEKETTNIEQAETIKKEIDLTNFDFDLPIDESAPKAKPRVHMAPGESACLSCEG